VTPDSQAPDRFLEIVERARELTREIQSLSPDERASSRLTLKPKEAKASRQTLEKLLSELEILLESMAAASAGPVQITLSRSYGIAQFFAFKFIHQPRLELKELSENAFYGSGIYAIYYTGNSFPAYAPLSGSETPIYVGKANPVDPYAETTVQQGLSTFKRLSEHKKTIEAGGFDPADFQYRCASVQSGLQDAVEGFLIRLFTPLWNKETSIAHGFGKHGDASTTRANRRSPWDTLHPGRRWAESTTEDQVTKDRILESIHQHFEEHPPFTDLDELHRKLAEV
jgi:hypothetical protein